MIITELYQTFDVLMAFDVKVYVLTELVLMCIFVLLNSRQIVHHKNVKHSSLSFRDNILKLDI